MKTKFNKLTKAQKRVAIAKDAIKQIRAKTIEVTQGNYFESHSIEIVSRSNIKTAINKAEPCQVCQIGQAIVCGIRLFNSEKVYNGMEPHNAAGIVQRWFGLKNAALMEWAFEGFGEDASGIGVGHKLVGLKSRIRAGAFYDRYPNDARRSIAIWENVIKNKGQFKP